MAPKLRSKISFKQEVTKIIQVIQILTSSVFDDELEKKKKIAILFDVGFDMVKFVHVDLVYSL